MYSSKKLLTLALLLTTVVCSFFFIVISSAADGALVSAEPDQIQYMQYGRSAAQGNPYIFIPGDRPSTGCTSHLYPFVLALFYKLGATGSSYFFASFMLNALFYMGIVVLAWTIAKKLYPRAATATLFLTVIGGHTLSAVFGQTDVGLFALVALALFACMLYGRMKTAIILTALCPWVRPEGMIFSIAFILSGIGDSAIHRYFPFKRPTPNSSPKLFLLCGILGTLSFAAVLSLNHLLTGQYQFMSVALKGYFKHYPFTGALQHTLLDLLAIFKGFFFGLSGNVRQFYHIPIIAGILGFAGILLRSRQNDRLLRCEIWLLLSIIGTFAVIASSQWQGLSLDRYLTWMFPLWTLYILIGVYEIGSRIGRPMFVPVTIALLALFQLASIAFVSTIKYSNTADLNAIRQFAKKVNEELNPDMSVGSTRGGGIGFYMQGRQIYNLHGINSPDFFNKDSGQLLALIDLVKHRRDLRFDFWLAEKNFLEENAWAEPFFGNLVMADTDSAISNPDALCLYETRWDSLDNGDVPQLLNIDDNKWNLVDSMDIGNYADEHAHSYSTKMRLKNLILPLCTKHAKLNHSDYSEVGRIILGSESFSILNATPHHPIKVVMRTANTTDGTSYSGSQQARITNLEMSDISTLHITVNGAEIKQTTFTLDRDGFDEISFEIPGEFVTSTPLVEIIGDHISYAYWFYQ